MNSTPCRNTRHRDSNPETPPSQKQRLKGLFRDGVWLCNCEPRKPARRFQVRKEGRTKGYWFYKCDQRPPCDLFLWDDDAVIRERGFTTSKDEPPPPRPKTPSFTQQPLTSYGVQVTPSTKLGSDVSDSSDNDDTGQGPGMETPSRAPPKRKRDVAIEDDDDFGDPDSDEERQMAALADASAERKSKSKPAPRNAFSTPSNPRTETAAGLPTPSVTRTLFPDAPSSRAAKRPKTVSFDESITTTPSTFSKTPTTTAPNSSPPASSPGGGVDVQDPTEKVMALLRPHGIPASVEQSIRDVLTTSTRQTRGIAMGREAARAAVREKDARIARMQEIIAALENKDRMNNSTITNMKASLMRLYHDS